MVLCLMQFNSRSCMSTVYAVINLTSVLSKRLHRHPCPFLFHAFFSSSSHSFFSLPFLQSVFCVLKTERKNRKKNCFTLLHSRTHSLRPLATCDYYITYYHFGFSFVHHGISFYWCPSVQYIITTHIQNVWCFQFLVTQNTFICLVWGFSFWFCHSKTFSLFTYIVHIHINEKQCKFHRMFGALQKIEKKQSINFYGEKYYL